jgi:hypothetical protein
MHPCCPLAHEGPLLAHESLGSPWAHDGPRVAFTGPEVSVEQTLIADSPRAILRIKTMRRSRMVSPQPAARDRMDKAWGNNADSFMAAPDESTESEELDYHPRPF